MTHLTHTHRKTDKQFFFEVQLNWLDKDRGILHANDAEGSVHVSTPAKFGGEGKEWSPEHLFLSSVSSCYMTTFLVFAKKMSLEIFHFECNAIGQIELVDGKYKFTHINLYPKIYIYDELLREKVNLAVEKTHKYCLIANSINTAIIYHTQILAERQPLAILGTPFEN